jgi:hypothetical protein
MESHGHLQQVRHHRRLSTVLVTVLIGPVNTMVAVVRQGTTAGDVRQQIAMPGARFRC